MPGVAGDQPSNLMSPVPGRDEAYDVKQGLNFKMPPIPPAQQPPMPQEQQSQATGLEDLIAEHQSAQATEPTGLEDLIAEHGGGEKAAPEQTKFGGGAMRQEFLSRGEANPMVQNLKYPAAAVGERIAGPPGAALAGAVAEAIGQASKAAQGGDVTVGSAAKESVLSGLETGAQSLFGSKILGPGLEAAGNFTKDLVGKSLHALQSMPGVEKFMSMSKQAVQTLGERAMDVAKLAGYSEGSVSKAADLLRSSFSQAVDDTKQRMNSQITEALKDSKAIVPIDSTIQTLKAMRDRLKPDIHSQDIAQINAVINKIEGRRFSIAGAVEPDYVQQPWMRNFPNEYVMSNKAYDKISVQDANELKNYLQGIVSDSYKKPGEMFTSGSGADKAVQAAAADLRLKVNAAAPNVAKANEALAELHNIDDTIHSSILKEGRPEKVLLDAGNRKNERTVQMLKRLGDITGTNMQEQAENLAAMATFSKPALANLETAPPIGNRMAAPVISSPGVKSTLEATGNVLNKLQPVGRALQQPGVTPALVGAKKALSQKEQ